MRNNKIMDFQKLKSILPPQIPVDIENATNEQIRVSYKLGDDDAWMEFTPREYENEEELAEAIKVALEKKGDLGL